MRVRDLMTGAPITVSPETPMLDARHLDAALLTKLTVGEVMTAFVITVGPDRDARAGGPVHRRIFCEDPAGNLVELNTGWVAGSHPVGDSLGWRSGPLSAPAARRWRGCAHATTCSARRGSRHRADRARPRR